MTELTIDNAQKTIAIELMLKGEKEPIKVTISRYSLTTKGEDGLFAVESITVSREWMHVFASEFLKDREITVPAKVLKWLKLIL